MKKYNLLCAIFVFSLLVWSNRLLAYTLTYTGLGYGSTVTLGIGGSSITTFAGEIAFGWTGATPSGFPSTFKGFCCELEQGLLTNTTVQILNTDSLTRRGNVPYTGSMAAWLYNKYEPTINNNADGAGLQIAIWKSLYDNDFDLSTGYFKVFTADAATLSAANRFLADLKASQGSSIATWFLGIGDSVNGQDVIGPYSSSFGYPAPEPGLISLLACASLSGVALIRKRNGRRP